MDHEGTREQLELAAVEPGGLERLMAGDTPDAQAVAAHLAGCPSCTDELVRLQRAATLIRRSVRELPPADLKERTLAAIRAEGVRRPLAVAAPVAVAAAAGTAEPAGGVTVMASPAAPSTTAMDRDRRGRRTQWLGWAGTIAAAVLLSVVTTTAVVNNRVDNELAAQNVEIAALEKVSVDTMGVAAQPDAEHVALHSSSDAGLTGDLVYSPSSTALVVTALGLAAPGAGQQYLCWVQVGGTRQQVGRMFFSTHLAYWTGPVPALSGLSDGATFGVSLDSVDKDPVLLGEL